MKREDDHQDQVQIIKQQIPRKKKIKKYASKLQNQKSGHWTQDQKINYIIFLEFHKDKFQFKQQRRTQKIFKIMSNIIQTRTPDQCRSHHQKMEKHYKDLQTIVEHQKASIRPQIYEVQYQKLVKNFNNRSYIFDQSVQEQRVLDVKSIVLIHNNPHMERIKNQIGFQSFSCQGYHNFSQYNLLQSIRQVYQQCLQQNNSFFKDYR